MRSKRLPMLLKLSVRIGCFLSIGFCFYLHHSFTSSSRQLALNDEEEPYDLYCKRNGYPHPYEPIGQGLLSCNFLEKGGFLLLILGILYMFVALAIVCDEFFVPALEVMGEVLEMSDDVAGATLMAAGGSAPELFTSFFGVFISNTDVGFGTIVGSAVFNVLFVIGMCAIFSKGVLELTWWPLARDCSCYTVALCVLAVFFEFFNDGSLTKEGRTPKQILWWEALILFLMYIGYVIIMWNNEPIQKKVKILCRKIFSTKVERFDSPDRDNSITNFDECKDNNDEVKKPTATNNYMTPDDLESDQIKIELNLPLVHFSRPSRFRAGVLELMISDKSIFETAGIHVVSNIDGDVKETFRKVAELCIGENSTSDTINLQEFTILMKNLGVTDKNMGKDQEIKGAFESIDTNGDGRVNYEEFEVWYSKSEARLVGERKRAFDLIDTDHNGYIDKDELRFVLATLAIKPTEEDLEMAFSKLDLNDDGKISEEEFIEWYDSSIFFQKRLSEVISNGGGDESEEDVDTLYPKYPSDSSFSAQLLYIVSFPIIFILYSTIPNVNRDCYKKYYALGFLLSIWWIGVFSYFMVWWADVLGGVLNIPPQVMGLTFLAAGTSVPDLLSSVIVAKQGKGDMAVSSSIGSNIFDVLVGLPVPWLIYTLANSKPQTVKSESLGVSILVLIGMLVAVIVTIAYNKWIMTKGLGYTMFILYVIFVAQDLLRAV